MQGSRNLVVFEAGMASFGLKAVEDGTLMDFRTDLLRKMNIANWLACAQAPQLCCVHLSGGASSQHASPTHNITRAGQTFLDVSGYPNSFQSSKNNLQGNSRLILDVKHN